MANLLGANIGTNYKGFLNLGNTINTELTATVVNVTDGMGNQSPLQLSSSIVGVSTNLGIGTTSPQAKLHVNGSIYLQNSTTGIESITFSNGPQIQANGPSGYFKSGQVYTNTLSNFVGIATSSPTTELDVAGVITATGGNSDYWNSKQDALVSGTNIKTINSTSILGSGNIVISGNPSTVGIQAGNATITNTTGINISKAITINANTLASSCVLDFTTRIARISGNTTMADIRIYFNTSNSLSGATLIARGVPISSTDQGTTLQRTFTISGGNITHTFGNDLRDTDVSVVPTAYSSSAYNVANTYYLLICITNYDNTDPFACTMAKFTQYA